MFTFFEVEKLLKSSVNFKSSSFNPNKLEENIVNIQKAIGNLQYYFSVQSNQTSLIKTYNKKNAT